LDGFEFTSGEPYLLPAALSDPSQKEWKLVYQDAAAVVFMRHSHAAPAAWAIYSPASATPPKVPITGVETGDAMPVPQPTAKRYAWSSPRNCWQTTG
jgi:hypothetical protein